MAEAALSRDIVDLLNKEPFEKGYSLIGFDAIEPLQLLQLLNDVLAHINDEKPSSVREEDPEEMLVRLLGVLRVLNYKPPASTDAKMFRAGLIGGQKDVIYPVLSWLLKGLAGFKLRAYLGKFLVRIEVPVEMLQNEEVAATNEKYTELISAFKEVHTEVENYRKSGFSSKDVKRDITLMEQEREQLKKRVEHIRRKCERLPQYGEMVVAARTLRKEQEREDELQRQANEQQTQAEHAEVRYTRAVDKLREVQSQSIDGGAEGLLARMEEENRMLQYLHNEKLPVDVAERKESLAKLQHVIDEPAMTRADLDVLHSRIDTLTAATNALIEERMINNNSGNDRKIAMFRQQASIIAHKKEDAAAKLMAVQEQLQSLESDLQKKRQAAANGGSKLKLEDFKKYVAKLRGMSSTYKSKKSQLNILRSENLILGKTKELLQSKSDMLDKVVEQMEDEKGVSGYQNIQEGIEKASVATSKMEEKKAEALIGAVCFTNKIRFNNCRL